MSSRDYVKSEVETLPDSIIEKLQEFILFQKFSLNNINGDMKIINDIQSASLSSVDFWDNPEDEVWDDV